MITYPAILNIPDKIKPIITKLDLYKYFLIEGGRGGAKSQSVARFILYLSDGYKLRIVCGRELWSNIEDSVYTLFVDLIREYNLNFDVRADKIIHRTTGSVIKFKGFREEGRVNIKGLEGVHILWIDEAEAITKKTLSVIIPTIRKENSKVFLTMNRYLKDDPVFVKFNERKDCLHIHLNYIDNLHCPETLKIEAEECKNTNIEEYNHIWLGQPLLQANNAAFRGVDQIIDYDLKECLPDKRYTYVLGVDLAKSVDFTVLTVICVELRCVVYWERMESENRSSWFYQKQKIAAISTKYFNCLTVVDSTGVGDPIFEDLQRMGVNLYYNMTEAGKETGGVKFTSTSKENIVEKLKVAIELKMIYIPNIDVLVTELKLYEAITTPNGRKRYGAPAGKHEDGTVIYNDDAVISLGLAVWGARDFIYEKYSEPVAPTRTDMFWNQVKKEVSKNSRQNEEDYDIVEGDEIIISD